MGQRIRRDRDRQVGGPSTSLLVLHGTCDLRTELPNSREFVARACGGASSPADRSLVELEGANHMLLYDRPDITTRVLDTLVKWVKDRC